MVLYIRYKRSTKSIFLCTYYGLGQLPLCAGQQQSEGSLASRCISGIGRCFLWAAYVFLAFLEFSMVARALMKILMQRTLWCSTKELRTYMLMNARTHIFSVNYHIVWGPACHCCPIMS